MSRKELIGVSPKQKEALNAANNPSETNPFLTQTLTENKVWKGDNSNSVIEVDFPFNDGGTLEISGGLIFGGSLTETISANTDDLSVTDLETTIQVRLDVTGNYSLTGLIPFDITKSQLIVVQNVGTGNLSLKNNDINSAANNRFLLGADTNIQPNEGITLVYDNTDLRWRSAGKNI